MAIEYEYGLENAKKGKEKSDIALQELEKEIRKLKKKSKDSGHGGWGTFSIVFEEATAKVPKPSGNNNAKD